MLVLGLESLKCFNACISRCIVTDARDSNSHVFNVNKILHVNDFTYLEYFCCRQMDFEPFCCLLECILVAPASSAHICVTFKCGLRLIKGH